MLEFTRFGTATWNYPGWRGIIYPARSPEKASAVRRLAWYVASERFRTVEADFTFYRPPTVQDWRRYAAVLPCGFPVVAKVWEEITVETFPRVERQGGRAGQRNPNYLNTDAFKAQVLGPFEDGLADNAGPLVFEFRRDWRPTPARYRAFLSTLDRFLGALPDGYRYAVEVRTRRYLTPEYLELLLSHGAAPVLNWWTAMPPLSEQFAVPGSAEAGFYLVRILVAPGREYADAVRYFSPYDRLKEEHPEMRRDVVAIARHAEQARKDLYVIVNNRAEGCAPLTIAAIEQMLGAAREPRQRIAQVADADDGQGKLFE